MTDTQYHEIKNFAFQDGTVIPSVSVAYLDINPTATKTALVITCFRGRLRGTCAFSSGSLKDHRIVVAALLGNGESSSPSNTASFPAVLEYADCIHAQHDLLANKLGVHTVDVVVGFSMGGQAAYHWTLMYPDMVKNAVIICSSARTSRHNYQFLEGPRVALENSTDYVPIASRTAGSASCVRGLRAFGKAYSAWLTSAEWFEQEQYKILGYNTLQAWDDVTTGSSYSGWDPDDLLVMLGMWQRSDITVHIGAGMDISLDVALSKIKPRVLLMPCRTDQYFRWEVSERESMQIPHATLKVIPSIWGHVAGGGAHKKDAEWMDQQIAEFLDR